MSWWLPIAASAAANLIRLVGPTWRFQVVGAEFLAEARAHSPAVIFAFWHGRMLALSYGYRGRSIHVLASKHRDGELMGQTVHKLGFGHVRGSSTRGGAQAILELVDKLAEGYDLGITVDGPIGPRFVVKPGPLEIAKLSGCAVVPAAVSSGRRWTLRSWDAFEVPKPFTTVSVRFGSPVTVPRDAAFELVEAKRQAVENTLRGLTRTNDEAVAVH